MASSSVQFSKRASTKALAHILKYQKHDCIGVLIGTKDQGKLKVTEVVPLFHDRVMGSALESALELIEMVHLSEHDQILGVYDAPLRYKQEDSPSLSPLAVTIAEQIKAHKDVLDVVVLSIRVPMPEQESEETKVREIRDEEEFVVEAFACGSTTKPKKLQLSFDADIKQTIKDLCTGSSIGQKVPKYFDIVDFDEHFVDISLDWTNPQFN